MVNGVFLKKFKEQTESIENILIKYLKQAEKIIESREKKIESKANKVESVNQLISSKKKLIDSKKQLIEAKKNNEILTVLNTIETRHDAWITSICILKDERLASSSNDSSIIIYNKLFQSQIYIKNAHSDYISSLRALRDGGLVSSSGDRTIKMWKINNNDFQLIGVLTGHSNRIDKVIELKDGKLCSCSADKTIKIWNNYRCVKTLTGHTGGVVSIIETNDYIVSASHDDDELRIWDNSKYQCIQIINNVDCYSRNSLAQVKENSLLLGGVNILYVVDVLTSQKNKIEDQLLGCVYCLNILRSGVALIGSSKGEICIYNVSFNQIIFNKRFHNDSITCIIETKDNKIISCSGDRTINIYK